jgi:hypothetical protein
MPRHTIVRQTLIPASGDGHARIIFEIECCCGEVLCSTPLEASAAYKSVAGSFRRHLLPG